MPIDSYGVGSDGGSASSGGRLGKTMQITAYHSGDDGDYEKGLLQQYEVLTTGQYSGTKNIEVACYAAATISFTAPDILADAANGLVTVLTGDTLVVKGSPANNGVYTVSGGSAADHFHVAPNVVNEGAGAVVSLYKRTPHSNECVRDLRTGLMWSRYTSNAEKVGEASTGILIWADVTKVYTVYSSANTISCVLPNIFRITGGVALTQFHVGDLIRCVGFVNGVNNTVGFRATAVTPNVGDLDIVIDPIKSVLVAEGAVGDSIGLVCRSIFNYAAGANLIGLGGYTDWRIANVKELQALQDFEAPTAMPNAVAFPVWPIYSWTATTAPAAVANAGIAAFDTGGTTTAQLKTGSWHVALVRP